MTQATTTPENDTLATRLTTGALAQIDFLRGLFALLVLAGHAFDVSLLYASKGPLYRLVAELRGILGFVWVGGFVVLSGFCIELSCMKQERKKSFSMLRYLAQRASRIFPLLVVCVVIAGLLEWWMSHSEIRPQVWPRGIDWNHLLINLAGAGGFFGQFGSIAPAYTISYELLYYLLWGSTRALVRDRVGWGLAANFGFALGYVMFPALSHQLPAGVSQVFSPFIVLVYIPWLLGAATARSWGMLLGVSWIRGISRYSWPILLVGAFMAFRLSNMPSFDVNPASIVYYALLSFGFVLLILHACDQPLSDGSGRRNHFLGELSYPLYLIHGPAIIFAGFLLNYWSHKLPFFVHFSFLILIAILMAYTLVLLVERPVMNARKRYFG